MAAKSYKPAPKRIPLMAGVPSRDYGLMQGANASPRRKPDGSQADAQPGDVGAFAQTTDAFPQGAQAFDGSDAGQ